MKNPRSCRGCRLYNTFNGTTGFCLHHYPVKMIESVLWRNYTTREDIFVNIKPAGRCPKPLSRAEASYWYKEWERSNIRKKL